MAYTFFIGQRFGAWAVIGERQGGKIPCRCDCGREASVDSYHLRVGKTTKCKACPQPKIDPLKYVGQAFGRWTIVSYLERRGDARHGRHYYLARCECGTKKDVDIMSLRHGRSQSCGCLNREIVSSNAKHAMWGSPEYWAWASMKDRCLNPNNTNYHRYGGRGITVCSRWMEFESFIADMGQKPSDRHTLDRINNDGGYGPDNCRWVVMHDQSRNKRSNKVLEIDGVSHCIRDWEKVSQVTYQTINYRLSRGWTPKQAVFTPRGGDRNAV